jgi:Uma2 family endonuclease
MSTLAKPTLDAPEPKKRVPPLQNGDRLTAEEFDRRYEATPEGFKAELIKGVVYVASPVTFDEHGGPHFDLIGWMALYRMATPGIRGGDNTTIRLPMDNRPQPDACLIIDPLFGGRVQIVNRYIVGGPEVVAEVAATSASIDLGDKFDVYRQFGIKEYIVWRVFDEMIDWFVLRGGQFEHLPLPPDGIYRSEALPGLWLDAAALIRGDMARVSHVAQQGIADPKHTEFIAQLNEAAARLRS